jgi:hypothetical protein
MAYFTRSINQKGNVSIVTVMLKVYVICTLRMDTHVKIRRGAPRSVCLHSVGRSTQLHIYHAVIIIYGVMKIK